MLRNTPLIAILALIAALSVPASSLCSKGCNCSENVAVCDTLNLEPFGVHILGLKISHPKVPLILKGQPFNVPGLENVNSITIENATIVEIDTSAFKGIRMLSRFSILNSNIPGISNPKAFAAAANLTSLRITNSTLKTFELLDSQSLEELDLSGCQLSEVKANSFVNIPNLSYINLSNNKLSKIDPLAFSELTDLEEVNLSNNNISSLNRDIFKNNTELVILNLGFNPLKKFDLNFMQNLENLVLKSCQLEDFSEQLSEDLFMLDHLDLSDNKINFSNKIFEQMVDLEYLDISSNGLESLDPHIFWSNDRLQKVILDNNHFSKFPKFVCRKGAFETYHFACKNCSIISLSPDTFKHFPAVVTLDLSHNYINGANLTALHYLATLIELNLSHNQISMINPNSFLNSSGLKTLNLAHNPLVSIDSNLFINNRVLENLDLSACALQRLWKRPVTKSIGSLRRLNIANNSFSCISPLDLLITPSIEVLDISHNPLQCDQLLRDTITWLTERGVSPATATLNWKTHEPMNEANVAEIEYNKNGRPSWRFLAKNRCTEEFYLSTFDHEEVKEEEETPPKKNTVDVAPTDKDNDLSEYYDDDLYDEEEYNDEDSTKPNDLGFVKNKDDQLLDADADYDFAERAFESTLFARRPTSHSHYSFLWPTLVFVFTALSVLVIAANIMLLMLRTRMIPRHVNLPHIKIPQWSATGKLKKHSGSVYQPLSEDRSGPYTPIVTRKDYVPTHTPKSVV